MNTSTPWFGISLGLFAMIAGSLLSPILSPASAQPAPAAQVVAAPTPVAAAPTPGCAF